MTDIQGPWRVELAVAYVAGAYAAPALLVLRALRRGVPGTRATAAALGLGSVVLLLDLVIVSSADAGVRAFALMTAVTAGAFAVAVSNRIRWVRVPPRPDIR